MHWIDFFCREKCWKLDHQLLFCFEMYAYTLLCQCEIDTKRENSRDFLLRRPWSRPFSLACAKYNDVFVVISDLYIKTPIKLVIGLKSENVVLRPSNQHMETTALLLSDSSSSHTFWHLPSYTLMNLKCTISLLHHWLLDTGKYSVAWYV